MAAVLLRLKLAIRRRGRGSTVDGQGALYWATWIAAAVGGLAGGALVAFLSGLDNGTALVLIVFTVLFVGWVVLPITTPALQDQTVDPTRLEMFPLTTGQKLSGLLLGGLVAPTALFTFLTASGGALAPDEPAAVRAAVPVVSALFVLLCVGASRAVQALSAQASSSRRGRDTVLVATGLVGVGAYLALQYFTSDSDALAVFSSSATATVLEWTPPGAAGQINLDMRAEDWTDAVGGLLYVLAWIGACLGGWYWALSRRARGGAHTTARRRSSSADASSLALIAGPLALLAPTATTAAAAQHAHYLFFRSPRASQQVLISVVAGAFLAHTSGLEHGLTSAAAILGGFVAISIGTGLLNYDGRGMRFLVVAGASMRPVILGKSLVIAAIAVAGTVLFVVAEAALGGYWDDAATAALAGAAAAVWASAVGAFASVVAPFDSEHRAPGRGRAVGWVLTSIAVVFATVIGAVWLASLTSTPVALNLAVAVVVAAIASWLVVRAAGARLASYQGEVAEAVSVG